MTLLAKELIQKGSLIEGGANYSRLTEINSLDVFNFCFRFSIHSRDTFTHFFNFSLTFTHLLTHSFTCTIIYLSVHLFIFHSLINLHQVIKVRLHSYFHAYVYTRHSLAKFLLLGNEVVFFVLESSFIHLS